ncbi:hypothetical protein [Providencia phage PSTCR6]|nr:hypothetical protein [Providencia phage PSTCR6]
MKITKTDLSRLRIIALSSIFLGGFIIHQTLLKPQPVEYSVQDKYEQLIPEHKYYVFGESTKNGIIRIQVSKQKFAESKQGDKIVNNEVNQTDIALILLMFLGGLIGWEILITYLTRKSFTN